MSWKNTRRRWPTLVAGTLTLALASGAAAATVDGLLRVHPENPRYLTNDSGEPILLVGPHTWHVFQDYDDEKLSTEFDYGTWLDDLESDGFTFFRGWTWSDGYYSPLPFEQVILQGRRVYDLTRWNDRYFERLRSRIQAAAEHGLYTSVLLFQELSVDDNVGQRRPNPWMVHPLNRSNNVQGLNARTHSGSRLAPIHTEYLRRMVEALYDLDNFIWEIGNGLDANAAPWISEAVRQLSEFENAKAASDPGQRDRRHLIWASCVGERSLTDFTPGTRLVSPCNRERYGVETGGSCFEATVQARPPAADGSRVVISDSSRLAPLASGGDWAWKSFFRALHPIALVVPEGGSSLPWWRGRCDLDRARHPTRELRATLAAVARVARKSDLAASVPQVNFGPDHAGAPSSSGYSLFTTANPGTSNLPDGRLFLVYQARKADGGQPLTVCGLLPGREYRVIWRKLDSGEAFWRGKRTSTDGCAKFTGTASGGILELALK